MNQKPLFKRISDSIGLVLRNDLFSGETNWDYLWHKLVFEEKL